MKRFDNEGRDLFPPPGERPGWLDSLPRADGEFTGYLDTGSSCICESGQFGREWVFQRSPRCTCGAIPPEADWGDFLTTIHAADCDSVPCPFCAWDSP